MPAYAIFIRENTRNEAEVNTYLEKAQGTGDKFGVKALAYYNRVRTLEGAEAQAVVLIEFPTFEDAEAWYTSEGYQKAKLHRHLGADYRVVITDGLAQA